MYGQRSVTGVTRPASRPDAERQHARAPRRYPLRSGLPGRKLAGRRRTPASAYPAGVSFSPVAPHSSRSIKSVDYVYLDMRLDKLSRGRPTRVPRSRRWMTWQGGGGVESLVRFGRHLLSGFAKKTAPGGGRGGRPGRNFIVITREISQPALGPLPSSSPFLGLPFFPLAAVGRLAGPWAWKLRVAAGASVCPIGGAS